MRNVHAIAVLASLLVPATMFAANPAITPPPGPTVGRNLQVPLSMKLTEPAPDEGLEVTVTSDDPARLLLARTPQAQGSKSIVIKVGAHYFETPDFYIRSLDDKGEATYTATARGFASGKGTVKLGKSSILIFAPLRAPRLWTTPRMPQRVGVQASLIDEAGKLVEPQMVAADTAVELTTSNPKTGTFNPVTVTIPAGESSMGVEFTPQGVGTASLSTKLPTGFSAATEFASVDARVEMPGMGVPGQITVGKDLQAGGPLLLGQPAPPGGVDVTLTSSDPKKLVLSADPQKAGSGVIKIHIPEGMSTSMMYVQGLAPEGSVSFTASAPGYRDRVGPITLAPSGFMVVYAHHGAPDEAEYLRPKTRIARPFVASLASKDLEQVAIWTVYLDPVTRRGADMTAQPLRPGISIPVELSSSDPTVGKLEPPVVKVDSSRTHFLVNFRPLKPGLTNVTVNTPPGFMTPSNATSVTATVKE